MECGTCAHWKQWRWKKAGKGECTDTAARLWLMEANRSAVTWADWSAERLGCGRWRVRAVEGMEQV